MVLYAYIARRQSPRLRSSLLFPITGHKNLTIWRGCPGVFSAGGSRTLGFCGGSRMAMAALSTQFTTFHEGLRVCVCVCEFVVERKCAMCDKRGIGMVYACPHNEQKAFISFAHIDEEWRLSATNVASPCHYSEPRANNVIFADVETYRRPRLSSFPPTIIHMGAHKRKHYYT